MMSTATGVAMRRFATGYLPGLLVAAAVLLAPMPASGLATGGDEVFEHEEDGRKYSIHKFTSPVQAHFNEAGSALEQDTNTVGSRTIQAGDVVYVVNSSYTDQIGNTYKASGGTDNWTWTLYGLHVTRNMTADVLAVAGGGAGGTGRGSGGGGAGRFVPVSMVLGPQFHPIRVGRGGNRDATSSLNHGGKGQDSVVNGVIAEGGGGGAGRGYQTFQTRAGAAGGSGGGSVGGGSGGAAGAGDGYGNNGGVGGGSADSTATGGGGGGAGEGQVGGDAVASPQQGGNGGNGRASDITGGWVTYSGGGGGASQGGTAGTGGSGGGGNGTTGNAGGFNAQPNTGGGGGGANNGGYAGGSGGSGIVIVRYEIPPLGSLILLR